MALKCWPKKTLCEQKSPPPPLWQGTAAGARGGDLLGLLNCNNYIFTLGDNDCGTLPLNWTDIILLGSLIYPTRRTKASTLASTSSPSRWMDGGWWPGGFIFFLVFATPWSSSSPLDWSWFNTLTGKYWDRVYTVNNDDMRQKTFIQKVSFLPGIISVCGNNQDILKALIVYHKLAAPDVSQIKGWRRDGHIWHLAFRWWIDEGGRGEILFSPWSDTLIVRRNKVRVLEGK